MDSNGIDDLSSGVGLDYILRGKALRCRDEVDTYMGEIHYERNEKKWQIVPAHKTEAEKFTEEITCQFLDAGFESPKVEVYPISLRAAEYMPKVQERATGQFRDVLVHRTNPIINSLKHCYRGSWGPVGGTL